MNISPELWRQIDPLLTDALDMEHLARVKWLYRLEQTHPQLTPVLRKILAAHDRAERSQELETVPKLAHAPPPSSRFEEGTRIGPFRLIRLLGRGGMGEVWLASQADGRGEREIALKLPTIYLHSEVWRERFRRERDILAKLAHPNIARLVDAGVSEEAGSRGQPYLAMEYIEGDSLTDFVTSEKLSIEERLNLFRQILAAVAYAHHQLVVHRDLKPANILVDKSGQVKLLDFGIAKLLGDNTAANGAADLTRLGDRVMTLRYAAPEQVSDTAISTATDAYALGVILHELVTGLSPYRPVREGRVFTEASLLGEEIAVPSSLRITTDAATERKCASAKILSRQIGGDIDSIILKAMRRNPADRYVSLDRFDDDIHDHLDRRPVKARAGTWRYLAGRFVARNKLPISATAALILTVAAGVVMVERERRVSVAQRERAETHFASVRRLANTFMFDVHDEIVGLQGSLKAREKLVNTSLQYLDSLAKEAGNDPSLAAELAVAYSKIANIQGAAGRPNLGRLSDSLANFEKSRKLFIALGEYKINDIGMQREHLMLRFALARAYAKSGDARWQENIAAAAKLAERVASLKGADPRDRSNVAGMLAEQANLTYILIGPSAETEASMNKAVSLLEELLREMPGEQAVRDTLAATYAHAANIFSVNRRTPTSLAHAIDIRRKALILFTTLAQENPNEQRYSKALTENQVAFAGELEQAGRYADADHVILLALKQLKAQAAADPNNAGELANILVAHGWAVRIAYRQGEQGKAIRRGREGLSHFASTPLELQKTLATRDAFSEVKTYLGLALMVAADKPGTAPDRQAAGWKEACALLADSVAFVEEVRATNPGVGDEGDVRERAEGLAHCRTQLAKLAVR